VFPIVRSTTSCDSACDVAQAVLYVHLVGWVHKSIRPDNILVFEEEEDLQPRRKFPHVLASPVCRRLLNTRGAFRRVSDRKSDAEWHVNIYRHPKTPVPRAERRVYHGARHLLSWSCLLKSWACGARTASCPFKSARKSSKAVPLKRLGKSCSI